MLEYSLAHLGVNAADGEQALEWAGQLERLFGLAVKEGNSSVFAGTAVEFMKKPGRGTHGHIGIATPDVAAAKADLESRGFRFDESSAKYKPDGALNAIYLEGEFFGFAIHLVKKA